MRALAILFLMLALGFAPARALALEAETLSPASAVAAALDFNDEEDGTQVTVEGEAIGEALVAPGGMRWVNLLGDGTALGVVMSAEDATAIARFGEYRQRGATVRVTGSLQRGCDEHGGDLDLHAVSVAMVDQGEELPHAVHPLKLGLALVAIIAAVLLWLRYRQLRRRLFLS